MHSRRLSQYRVKAIFQLFLDAVRQLPADGDSENFEILVKNERIAINRLSSERLESILAPEWHTLTQNDPLRETDLYNMCLHGAQVNALLDTDTGVCVSGY